MIFEVISLLLFRYFRIKIDIENPKCDVYLVFDNNNNLEGVIILFYMLFKLHLETDLEIKFLVGNLLYP